MPRPTKYSAKTRDAILAAIAVGCSREQAAAVAGIGERTLYDWLKAKPQLSQDIEKAEAAGVQARLQRIEQAAQGGAWQADAWWLERRYPEQWGRRDRVNVHHEGEVQLRQVVEARTVIMQALAAFPDARLKVADALEQLDAVQQQAEAEAEESSNGNGR